MDGVKNILIAVFVFFVLTQFFGSGCQQKPKTQLETRTTEQVHAFAKDAAKGLDLKAVSALALRCRDAKTFEEKLNSYGEGVNNLDLNQDGNVDFIAVTEFGSGTERGFSLTTHPALGEEVELATIHFHQSEEKVEVEAQGSRAFYPNQHVYRSSFGLTDALLLHYIFSDHGHYRGGWGYGRYPSSYGRGWRTRSEEEYQTSSSGSYGRSTTSAKDGKAVLKPASSASQTPKAVSPNQAKTVTRAKSITSPTSSQKSFTTRSSSKPVSSGGFGRTSSSSYGGRSSSGGGK